MTTPADYRSRCGRHTEHRPEAVPVAVLLAAAMQEGQPIRLAWPDTDLAADDDEFPTAELPAIPAARQPRRGGLPAQERR